MIGRHRKTGNKSQKARGVLKTNKGGQHFGKVSGQVLRYPATGNNSKIACNHDMQQLEDSTCNN